MQAFIDNDDIASVIKSMLEDVYNPEVQANGCRALSNMASKHENKLRIAFEGGIEVIIGAMNDHISDVIVQKEACKTLKTLTCHNKENRITIPSEGGIEAILNAMKEHVSNIDLQVEACQALYNLACNDQNKEIIINEGGILVVLKIMIHCQDPGLLMEACKALRIISYKNDKNKLIIPSEGGIQAIIDAMQDHILHTELQREACKALYNLACDDTNKSTIASENGIKVIIRSMKTNTDDADVQKEACKVLYNLSFNFENKALILSDNGINAVICAMKTHEDDVDVQKEAFKLLRHLSSKNTKNKLVVAREGGILHILSIMNRYIHHAKMQKEACKAVSLLIKKYPESKISFPKEEYIRTILNILNENTDHASVQEEALKALKVLTGNHSREKMIELDGNTIIINAMKKQSYNETLFEEYSTLILFMSERKGKALIDKEDDVRNFVGIMKDYRQYPSLQITFCKILFNYLHIKNNRFAIIAEGGIECLNQLMREHFQNRELLNEVLITLKKLIFHQEERITFFRQGGITEIFKVMKHHTSDARVQQEALKMLRNMTVDEDMKISNADQYAIEYRICTYQQKRNSFMKKRRSAGSREVMANIALSQLAEKVPEVKAAIGNEGGIEIIMNAMKMHISNVTVQHEGCKVLSNLAINDTNKSKLDHENAIEMIMKAMELHFAVADFQKDSFKFLYNLSFNVEYEAKIVDNDCIKYVIKAMRHHEKNVNLQNEGCRLLRKLALNNDDVKEEIVREGGIQVVVSAYKNTSKDSDLVEQVEKTLEILSDDQTGHLVRRHSVLSTLKMSFFQ